MESSSQVLETIVASGYDHGHVDHGKTSLLDALENTMLLPEKWRHHPAYRGFSSPFALREVITFIDTPWPWSVYENESSRRASHRYDCPCGAADDGIRIKLWKPLVMLKLLKRLNCGIQQNRQARSSSPIMCVKGFLLITSLWKRWEEIFKRWGVCFNRSSFRCPWRGHLAAWRDLRPSGWWEYAC